MASGSITAPMKFFGIRRPATNQLSGSSSVTERAHKFTFRDVLALILLAIPCAIIFLVACVCCSIICIPVHIWRAFSCGGAPSAAETVSTDVAVGVTLTASASAEGGEPDKVIPGPEKISDDSAPREAPIGSKECDDVRSLERQDLPSFALFPLGLILTSQNLLDGSGKFKANLYPVMMYQALLNQQLRAGACEIAAGLLERAKAPDVHTNIAQAYDNLDVQKQFATALENAVVAHRFCTYAAFSILDVVKDKVPLVVKLAVDFNKHVKALAKSASFNYIGGETLEGGQAVDGCSKVYMDARALIGALLGQSKAKWWMRIPIKLIVPHLSQAIKDALADACTFLASATAAADTLKSLLNGEK
jgi:hypothetical protein